MKRFDTAARRARIGQRHLLAPSRRTDDLATVADALVALHSSDPVSVHLGVAVRMRHPSIEAVERALYVDRTLIRHHAMRRTLWVFTPAMARAAHTASTSRLVGPELRRLSRLVEASDISTDGEGWYRSAGDAIVALLTKADDPMTAREIGTHLPELTHRLVAAGGTQAAHTRALTVLGFEGAIVRARPTGTWINGQYRWTATDRWWPGLFAGAGTDGLDDSGRLDEAATLAHRWLHAFGPAPASDLQWWTGWPGGLTARALERAAAIEVDIAGTTGWVARDDETLAAGDGSDDRGRSNEPWVALLPGLDPTVMGWKQRDWYLDPAHVPLLFDVNGNAGPTVWADGRVVGGWHQRRDGEIVVRLLDDVGAEHHDAIGAAAAELVDLLGDVRFRVRFPAPLQAELDR